MKLLKVFIFFIAFLMLNSIKSSEAENQIQQLDELSEGLVGDFSGDLLLNRQKRDTCEIDRILCVAHCRLKGFQNGLCTRKKICVCRR